MTVNVFHFIDRENIVPGLLILNSRATRLNSLKNGIYFISLCLQLSSEVLLKAAFSSNCKKELFMT